jgi:hypothetical protein
LINKEWYNQWISFLYGETDLSPKKIDNDEMVQRIKNEGFDHLKKNIDYFEIPFQIWNSLTQIYGGGPAILINFDGKVEVEPAKNRREMS